MCVIRSRENSQFDDESEPFDDVAESAEEGIGLGIMPVGEKIEGSRIAEGKGVNEAAGEGRNEAKHGEEGEESTN